MLQGSVSTHTSGMVKGRVIQRSIHRGHVALAVPLRHGALEQLVRGANHAQGLRHVFGEADCQSQVFLSNVSIKTDKSQTKYTCWCLSGNCDGKSPSNIDEPLLVTKGEESAPNDKI